MSNKFDTHVRTSLHDPVLVTDLKWHPGARRPSGAHGALVGALLGVQVNGMDVGRGTAFQFATVFGEIRTVYWDGTMSFGDPVFYDVDTGEMVLRNSLAIAWFARLKDVAAN